MRIDYSQFNAATRMYRGLAAKGTECSIEVTDNKSFEKYLKTLERDGLKETLDKVYACLTESA